MTFKQIFGIVILYLAFAGSHAIAKVNPQKYTYLDEFHDGLAAFSTMPLNPHGKESKDFLMGFINKQGKVVIPERYIDVGNFSEGVTWVKEPDGKRWLINKAGKKLWQIPPEYARLSLSQKGLIYVANRVGNEALVNHAGKEIVPFGRFDTLSISGKTSLIVVIKDNKIGLLDLQGKQILPLSDFDGGEDSPKKNDPSLLLYKGDQFWRYNKNGKLIQTDKLPYTK